MVDISKCFEEDCKLKDKCYRYTAPPEEYQSYLIILDHNRCEHFIDNGKE